MSLVEVDIYDKFDIYTMDLLSVIYYIYIYIYIYIKTNIRVFSRYHVNPHYLKKLTIGYRSRWLRFIVNTLQAFLDWLATFAS
jgi:hypothetical protein